MIKGEIAFVNSGSLRLWTERFGAPADPVVLLIMGTSAQGISWPDELVQALVNGRRQVIRFDHRDTGQSDCVDFAAAPYTISDMARDALAVLDGHQVTAAHIAGASLGGGIAQLLAVHHPDRVRTLTAIMTSPMGYRAGPAWARALAGQPPEPGDLPAPAPEFLRHVAAMASSPPATPAELVTANTETWRILNGTTLPFDADAARRHVEASIARARDFQAATHHDLAGRQMTPERQAPLSRVTAPTLVIHGTGDPLLPLANGQALAALIPGARFEAVPGMGHGFFAPGIPAKIARLILDHTAVRP
ncbi:MAG TPA: alpha/beta hydrolase [Streptosporangiaceae bacterium]